MLHPSVAGKNPSVAQKTLFVGHRGATAHKEAPLQFHNLAYSNYSYNRVKEGKNKKLEQNYSFRPPVSVAFILYIFKINI